MTDLTSHTTPELSVFTGPAADAEAIERVEQTLDRLEELSSLLETAEPYEIPPPEFELPEGFRLSVVIPVYNEQATIGEILARVSRLPLPKEIILIDDCSTDRTQEFLRSVEHADDVRVIYKPQNEGKGAALRDGFAAAAGDVVIVQDADLEYDPRDIPPLLAPLVSGEADVVYGSRFLHEKPQDPSWIHRLGNGLLTRASNLCTGLRLTDMETCYKAFRRDVLTDLCIQQNRFGFEPEVTAKLARAGRRIVERPISYNARSYAEGKKIGPRDLLNAFWCIVRYRWSD